MPRPGITAYDLLISCPGDVSRYIEVVKECIDGFNTVIGRINNAEIVARHWSTDSYAQSGDKPQELLNKQFVRECDAAIAIFWTRFGTPTDKYGSGTEEEIEEMLSADKQVFMYFVDEPVNMSEVDVEQYKKVQTFKEKYKDRGIYFSVKNQEELRRLFTNHLSMHFLPIIVGEQDVLVRETKQPKLNILDYNVSKSENISVRGSSYLESRFIKDMEKEILENIANLQRTVLPKREKKCVKLNKNDQMQELIDAQKVLRSTVTLNGPTIDADIKDEWKIEIVRFLKRFSKEITEEFWNVGNLTITESLLNPMFGGGEPSLNGTDKEKQHYSGIEELYWKIVELNEYRSYLEVIDRYKTVELVLANEGTTFDEDIDVKLYIEKGKIIKNKKIPVPGILTIDTLLDMKFEEIAFKVKETDNIDGYTGYPLLPQRFDYRVNLPFTRQSEQEEYADSKQTYYDKINRIFCYNVFEKEEVDVLTFHISYLKHNTKMAFPSVLIFEEVPEFIEYEITSKHTSKVIKGKLKFS